MKHIILSLLCVVCTFSLAYAQDGKKKDNKETVTFSIENMHCANCVKKVEQNIAFEKGVTDLKCNLKEKKVEVTYRTDKTTEANLVSAFKKLNMDAVAEGNKGDKRKEN